MEQCGWSCNFALSVIQSSPSYEFLMMAIIFYDSKRQLRLESRERENKDDLLLLSCIMIIIIIENEFCVHWHMSTSWTRRLMAEITTRPTVHSLHSHPASSSSSSSYSRRRFVLLIIFMHRWRCAMQSTRRGKLRNTRHLFVIVVVEHSTADSIIIFA